jgi:hypothetical protein
LRAYEVRFQIYAQAFGLSELLSPRVEAEIGKGWTLFERVRTNSEAVLAQAANYNCSPSNDLQRTTQILVDEGRRSITNRFVTDYTNLVIKTLNAHQQTATTGVINLAILGSAVASLTKVNNDLAALTRFPEPFERRCPTCGTGHEHEHPAHHALRQNAETTSTPGWASRVP